MKPGVSEGRKEWPFATALRPPRLRLRGVSGPASHSAQRGTTSCRDWPPGQFLCPEGQQIWGLYQWAAAKSLVPYQERVGFLTYLDLTVLPWFSFPPVTTCPASPSHPEILPGLVAIYLCRYEQDSMLGVADTKTKDPVPVP